MNPNDIEMDSGSSDEDIVQELSRSPGTNMNDSIFKVLASESGRTDISKMPPLDADPHIESGGRKVLKRKRDARNDPDDAGLATKKRGIGEGNSSRTVVNAMQRLKSQEQRSADNDLARPNDEINDTLSSAHMTLRNRIPRRSSRSPLHDDGGSIPDVASRNKAEISSSNKLRKRNADLQDAPKHFKLGKLWYEIGKDAKTGDWDVKRYHKTSLDKGPETMNIEALKSKLRERFGDEELKFGPSIKVKKFNRVSIVEVECNGWRIFAFKSFVDQHRKLGQISIESGHNST